MSFRCRCFCQVHANGLINYHVVTRSDGAHFTQVVQRSLQEAHNALSQSEEKRLHLEQKYVTYSTLP